MRAKPTIDTLNELAELDEGLRAHVAAAHALYVRKGKLLDLCWGTAFGTPTAARDEAGPAWLEVSTPASRAVAELRGKPGPKRVGGYGFDRATGNRSLRIARRAVVHALLQGHDASDAEWSKVGGRYGGAGVDVETLARGMGVGVNRDLAGDPRAQNHKPVPVHAPVPAGPFNYEVKTTPIKRGRGRPPGSKNKFTPKKGPIQQEAPVELNIQQLVAQAVAQAIAQIQLNPPRPATTAPPFAESLYKPPVDEELGEAPEGPEPFSRGIPRRFQEYIPPPPIVPPPPPFKGDRKFAGVQGDDQVDFAPRDFSRPPQVIDVRPPTFKQEEPAPYVIPDDGTYDPYSDRG